ncbi:hypothetical protein BV20DRAFT_1118067 [Pilatotrama ljubarskyi]|nr:hypothetical protein BV20DRAFT_1118067 [Pilatotrama ljubarskyi]
MFLLPFVIAGALMLSVLNPRYASDLVSHAIPHIQLLGHALSHVSGLLVHSPGLYSHLINYHAASTALPTVSEVLPPVRHSSRTNSSYGRCSSGITLRTLPQDDAHFAEPFEKPISDSEALTLLLLLLMLCLLWGACSSLTDQFRLPQPLSTAASVVEELVIQSSPKAFTPNGSPELGGLPAEQVGDVAGSPIPANLHFVSPGGNELFGGSSFILNTRAALDAILAIPTRIGPQSSDSSGSLAEVDGQPMHSLDVSPVFKSSVRDAKASETAQGIHRLMAQSGSLPPWRQRQQQHASRAGTSAADPAHATGPGSPIPPPNSPTISSPPARRGRGQPPPGPLLEDAVMFTVKSTRPSGTSSGKTSAASPAVQSSSSAPACAFIEEVPESHCRSTTQSPRSSDMAGAGKYRIPQRQPRPRHPPPVTVWPRVPLEARRSRMPSVQPIRMTAGGATSWDQPCRSRTVSGM